MADQARHKDHDYLGHQGESDEDEAVEEQGRRCRQGHSVDVVEGHGGEGDAECSRCPGEAPPTGLPVLSQSEAQHATTVPGQGREGGSVQADPSEVRAPFHG